MTDKIVSLLEKPFSSLSIDDKLAIINEGRPTPEMPKLKTQCVSKRQTFVRYFENHQYEKCKWITGSHIRNKLYCWPCLLFYKESEKCVWNVFGFSDLNHLSAAKIKHEKSQAHINNSLTLKTFGEVRIDLILDHNKYISIVRHNEKVKKNRNILKILIDVCVFLGSQELAFRGRKIP